MKEFIKKIITSEDIDEEEKIQLIEKIINVSMGKSQHINEFLYLKTVFIEETKETVLQLWSKMKDGQGKIIQKNTGFNNNQIIDILHKEYLKEKNNIKQKRYIK